MNDKETIIKIIASIVREVDRHGIFAGKSFGAKNDPYIDRVSLHQDLAAQLSARLALQTNPSNLSVEEWENALGEAITDMDLPKDLLTLRRAVQKAHRSVPEWNA